MSVRLSERVPSSREIGREHRHTLSPGILLPEHLIPWPKSPLPEINEKIFKINFYIERKQVNNFTNDNSTKFCFDNATSILLHKATCDSKRHVFPCPIK